MQQSHEEVEANLGKSPKNADQNWLGRRKAFRKINGHGRMGRRFSEST
jgi:hypothetical protein